jgi:carbamoyl-phosphate synthase large subunit
MSRSLNILFSCVGRRVSLLEGFRRVMADLGVPGHVYGADWSPLAPAFHRVDEGFLVSGVNSPNYVDDLLDVCRRKKIDLVIPLIDWELQVLAEARERFQEVGTRMLVSSPAVVEICRDKRKTCEFLVKSGLDAPRVFSFEEAADGPFPLFMKPRFGSSTRHVRFVYNRQALKRLGQHASRFIIQECVRGTEFTVDVYAGLDGVPRVAVPRERLQVRAGEVAKGRTVRHEEIIRKSLQAVEALAECAGVITMQCFLTAEGAIKFFDLNPRFGGGVPLSIEAGADFPRWIIQEHFGERPEIDPEGWQAGLVMLRYDAEVFCKAKDVGMAE